MGLYGCGEVQGRKNTTKQGGKRSERVVVNGRGWWWMGEGARWVGEADDGWARVVVGERG